MKPPSQSRIVVCGIVRDSEDVIVHELQTILSALNIFKEVFVIVVESESTDSTLVRLNSIARNEKRLIVEHIEHSGTNSHFRSVRVAEARNRTLQILNSEFSKIDYIYVIDLDGINRDLTADGVMSCFKYGNWTMMSSNQPKGYYDILALRQEFWCNYDYGTAFLELKKYFSEDLARYISLDSKSLKIPISNPIIPVQSAFGGGAIYVADALKDKLYLGVDSFGRQICEHLNVNLAINQELGNMFINPALVNIRHLGRSQSKMKRVSKKVINLLMEL